jgi:DNA-binding MarR family transcriptional regulator
MPNMPKDLDTIVSLSLQISRLLTQQCQLSFEERAATILQFEALSYLQKNPQSNLSFLAEHLHLSLSSATQLIDRMSKIGYVHRKNDQEDRRVIHLSITSEGTVQLQQLKEAHVKKLQKLFSKVDSKDISSLIRIQEKILTNLEKNIAE